MTDKTPTVDQFQGCILGCALGDVVGAWGERKPLLTARRYAGQTVRPVKFKEHDHHDGLPFGQYTDDTQLTRELALSIAQRGFFDPPHFAERVSQIFARNGVVGYGKSTLQAAQRLAEGCPWDQAGTPAPAAGNGAAMRAAPIGLLHWNDTNLLIRDATNQAIITHSAEMSVAGSVAIAATTAMCLNASRDTSHPGERGWWKWLVRIVGRSNTGFEDDLDILTERVFGLRDEGQTSDNITESVYEWIQDTDDSTWAGISPWARSSVLWSLYCLAAHPTDIWEAITLAIWGGGDTDSTAAMAGALVGAHIGMSRFPTAVLEKVTPRVSDVHAPEWDWKKLKELGALLHAAVINKQTLGDVGSPVLEMFSKEGDA